MFTLIEIPLIQGSPAAAESFGNDVFVDQMISGNVQDKLLEAGNEGIREKGDAMVKRLDSIVGSDQWGRKKKRALLGDDLGGGGRIKRGILGIDLWGKKKRAMENINNEAEESVRRNIGSERMMEKRAILGLDLWGRRKRIISSRNILLGTGDRCPHL